MPENCGSTGRRFCTAFENNVLSARHHLAVFPHISPPVFPALFTTLFTATSIQDVTMGPTPAIHDNGRTRTISFQKLSFPDPLYLERFLLNLSKPRKTNPSSRVPPGSSQMVPQARLFPGFPEDPYAQMVAKTNTPRWRAM